MRVTRIAKRVARKVQKKVTTPGKWDHLLAPFAVGLLVFLVACDLQLLGAASSSIAASPLQADGQSGPSFPVLASAAPLVAKSSPVSWRSSASMISGRLYHHLGSELVDEAPQALLPQREVWVWLWNNYSANLAVIASHKKAGVAVVVSPDTYYLDDQGLFSLNPGAPVVCPQVAAMGLVCVPMIQNDQNNPAGINALLTNLQAQSAFVSNAVSEAVTGNFQGYCVDVEPSSGVLQVSSQFGAFLTSFAHALHSVGKELAVVVSDFDSGLMWNFTLEGQSSVDLVVTMNTYAGNLTQFYYGLSQELRYVPLGKVAAGLMTGLDDSTISQRYAAIAAANVSTIMIWPTGSNLLPDAYWDASAAFMSG